MCAYFEQEVDRQELAALLEALGLDPSVGDEPPGAVRPTDPAIVIDQRGLRIARFGLAGPRRTLILNARVETLHERTTFRPLLEGGRCLVPMSSFEEPGVLGTRRTRMRFAPRSGRLIGVGLRATHSFALVTRQAAPEWEAFHERMPALVDLEAGRAWLHEGVLTLLEPTLDATPIASNTGRHPGQAAL